MYAFSFVRICVGRHKTTCHVLGENKMRIGIRYSCELYGQQFYGIRA